MSRHVGTNPVTIDNHRTAPNGLYVVMDSPTSTRGFIEVPFILQFETGYGEFCPFGAILEFIKIEKCRRM